MKIIKILQMMLVCSAISAGVLSSAAAEFIELPARTTPIPPTTNSVPHIQLGVKPNLALSEELLARVVGIPDVEVRNTVISLPGAKGFWLNDKLALVNPQVLVGGREFAHVHPDGSLHASLPPELAVKAVEAGWATPHPWAKKRPGWEGFVMIYTPPDAAALDVVFGLVLESYNFVTGRSLVASTNTTQK